VFKSLTKIIAWRLEKEVTEFMPPEQHGFRKGKSTNTAIRQLMEDVERTLAISKQAKYVAFVDFSKAFDSIPRSTILSSLQQSGVTDGPMLRLIQHILTTNYCHVFDGLQMTNSIAQNIGILQGDTLSPLLFSITVVSLINDLKECCGEAGRVIMYADDLAIYSDHLTTVQEALNCLERWCDRSGLTVNQTKTEAMKFRRRGKLSANDNLYYKGTQLKFVNQYEYLGLIIPFNCKGFAKHVKNRASKALRATYGIKNPRMLSVETAHSLFKLKIQPIITYGLQHIWKYLTPASLCVIDGVKAAFVKRTLGISRMSSSRLAYLMADTQPLVIDLLRNNA